MVKPKISGEKPGERFKRLAEKRTQEVIHKIRILSNCSDPRRYKYSQDQVNLIFRAIDNELKKAKMKFKATEDDVFKL